MLKLEKYLAKYSIREIRAERSIYFHFKGRIIRLSDHIGKNSTAMITLIPKNENQIIYFRHLDNTIEILNYKQVKNLVRTFNLIDTPNINSEEFNILIKHISYEMNKKIDQLNKIKSEIKKLNK